MSRIPVAAGRFYAGNEKELKKEIEACMGGVKPVKADYIAAVSPHAGFIYSGNVAALTLSSIKTPDIFLILGPNHTGAGEAISVASKDSWETPLGLADIDTAFQKAFLKSCDGSIEDDLAHLNEHSIEVQLPFLQYFHKDFKILPVCLALSNLAKLKKLGEQAAECIQKSRKKVCILASSDMNHYESQEITSKKDKEAIDAVISLDEAKLYDVVRKYGITMCGVAPAIVMISAAKKLGAGKAELVKYMTSGDTSGDYAAVVGYAGILIK